MAKSMAYTESTSNENLRALLLKFQTAFCDFVFNSGALAIKTSSSALAKTVNTINALVDGVLVQKAAADMAALSGTIATGKKGIFVFTLKADGTLTTRAGTLTASALSGISFPTIPAGEVVIGFIIVENATGSDFVGGTTALDTASLTVTYVNTPFPFNPAIVSL
ncbi:MAG: hypothetical protein HY959_03740 [Ignavibacteriae bacterium]|nr:hypothetical protein [Ignavibacteriota bacterium]